MAMTFQQSYNALPSWPAHPPPDQIEHQFLTGASDSPEMRIGRNDRVLHRQRGVGRVLHGSDIHGTVNVEFRTGIHEVPGASLRRLLPVTALARTIEKAGMEVTSWAVRKAHDQGAIQPDAIGRFAGHDVHYYDVARIPDLIRQLSQPDRWTVGTLVSHLQHGFGIITGYAPQPGTGGTARCSARVVTFFNNSSGVAVCIQELRRLVPGYVIAGRLGVNRRQFPRLAALRGIHPDYVAPNSRIREFYDESRTEDIGQRWSHSATSDTSAPGPIVPGRMVLDANGEPARVETRDARGQAQIRELYFRAQRRTADVTSLQQLVSLRELARAEHMSRYKLKRLLTAAGMHAACQSGKTLYYDRARAHAAVQERLEGEINASTLGDLAARTGVSEAVLTNKIRRGIIRTLGHGSAHRIEKSEAQRIEKLIEANRSSSECLNSLGICALHRRGRVASEVVRWNVPRLLEVARSLSPDRRSILFGQVSWMCEGSGEKRFREALDSYLVSLTAAGEHRECTQLLLTLLDHLPGQQSRYRIRLLLLTSGNIGAYTSFEQRVRQLAILSGCDHQRSFEIFRVHLDHCLTELLTLECAKHPGGQVNPPSRPRQWLENECLPGAIVVWGRDRIPRAGLIVRIVHQRWNAVSHAWRNTLIVRFPDGERGICSDPRTQPAEWCSDHESLRVLLRASDVRVLSAFTHSCLQRSETPRVRGLAGSVTLAVQ